MLVASAASHLTLHFGVNIKGIIKGRIMYTTQKGCKVCGGELVEELNLGKIYPSNFISGEDEVLSEPVPLILVRCIKCQLVQLLHTVDLDLMYRNYWYHSSLNQGMVSALKDIVDGITSRVKLTAGDIILDIGANDGTMLSMFPFKYLRIGFDPARNLKGKALVNCDEFINDYFSADKYPVAERARVITTIAMFYDLPDPNKFVKDIKQIMRQDGIWVIQLMDLLPMLWMNDFTNCCFEHLEYYGLKWLVEFLKSYGLEVFDLERNQVNGGSIRLYVSYPGQFPANPNIPDYLKAESDFMNITENPIAAFAHRVEAIKAGNVFFLERMKKEGKVVMGLGASTKGSTMLQYFGVTPDLIRCIGDVNKDKFGLKTVGSNIPIISESDMLKEKPDVIMCIIWQHFQSLKPVLDPYLQGGGIVLTPLPEPEVRTKYGIYRYGLFNE